MPGPRTNRTQLSFGKWTNWARNQHAKPAAFVMPRTEDELSQCVRGATELRVVGAGHSFSALVPTTGTLVSLDDMQGLVSYRSVPLEATAWAGTRLRRLGSELHDVGQALPNQGDIDHQSLAGVVSTGTHGTGITLGCLSSFVTGLRLITASGEVISCDATNHPEIFQAARVSLGALGVLSQVTLQTSPAYRLAEHTWVQDLAAAMSAMVALRDSHRHAEMWAFPFGHTALVKTLDVTEEPATVTEIADGWGEDIPLLVACELARWMPRTRYAVQARLRSFVSESKRVGPAHLIFPNERRVRFREMEYQVPAERGLECLEEICETMRKADCPVMFPIEFRYVAQDDIWLSPFGGSDRASISVHQYDRVNAKAFFDTVEPVFWRYGGVPHWGKSHSLGARELAARYPRWGDFHRIRRDLDPSGKFLNAHVRSLFDELG